MPPPTATTAALPAMPPLPGPQRALSVWQPWAWALVQGLKDVENRSRRTNWQGWLWIHAGLRLDHDALGQLLAQGVPVPEASLLPRGCLVGAVELTGCVRDSPSRWAVPGQWHWQVGRSWALPEPIEVAGRLGLFRLDPRVAHAAAEQLRAAREGP